MYLDPILQARVALEDALDRLQQVDVGSREELDLRHGHAAEQPAVSAGSQLPEPDVRMQVAGVHDAEDAVLRGEGSPVKSSASNPFVIETTVRLRSSGKASSTRFAASGVFMTTAAAFPSADRMRRRSAIRCAADG